jgi:hypothetical protein
MMGLEEIQIWRVVIVGEAGIKSDRYFCIRKEPFLSIADIAQRIDIFLDRSELIGAIEFIGYGSLFGVAIDDGE